MPPGAWVVGPVLTPHKHGKKDILTHLPVAHTSPSITICGTGTDTASIGIYATSPDELDKIQAVIQFLPM